MLRLHHLVVAWLLLAAVAAGGQPFIPPAIERHNIVLITMDTTRADHLGSYGWEYAKTPNLDALARRGTRFARCDTAAPITLTSHATILTGLFPPRHGVRDNGTFVLPAGMETVASRLRAAGYDTGAVVSAIVLARRYGLDRGFRIYDDDMGRGYAAGTEVSERQAEDTTQAALAVLKQLKPPFFLWVHYFDPHEEYRPPTRFADSIRGPQRLYDGEIAYVDEQLGLLLGKLPADVEVAVTGDHGEMLGEHGELTHGLLLNAGVRRVPLILAGPDVPAGESVQCLVRTADVAPTLLKWAGASPPAGLDGAPLLPLPTGTSCDRLSYSESFLPFFAYDWYPLRSISDGRFLYLRGPVPSLYSLTDDPVEEHDIASQRSALATEWEDRLRRLLAGMGDGLEPKILRKNEITNEQRQLLASLGYLSSGGGGQVTTHLPDPRAMTGVARQLHAAVQKVQEGKCSDALPELKSIAEVDPRNFSATTLFAQCLQEEGKYEAALILFRRAAQENQLSAVPVANVAGCLLKLGRKDDAVQQYDHALVLDPTQAESAANLARLLRERSDVAGALRVLDNSIAAGSHAPAVFLERGLALADAGRLAEALADFHQAARRNPLDPVPLENAARTAYQLKRYSESAQDYEQLLRLSPNQRGHWKTLGALYLLQLNDRPNCLRAFRQALRLETDPGERAKVFGQDRFENVLAWLMRCNRPLLCSRHRDGNETSLVTADSTIRCWSSSAKVTWTRAALRCAAGLRRQRFQISRAVQAFQRRQSSQCRFRSAAQTACRLWRMCSRRDGEAVPGLRPNRDNCGSVPKKSLVAAPLTIACSRVLRSLRRGR
jgi:choline-sulfatase